MWASGTSPRGLWVLVLTSELSFLGFSAEKLALDFKMHPPQSRAWWHMPLIPALGRQRQADFWVRGKPGLQSEFQDSQGYTEKPFNPVSKNKQTNKQTKTKQQKKMSIAAISLQTLEGVGVSLCKVFKRPLLHITVTSIFLFVVVMRVRVIISFSGKCTLLKWSFYSYQKKN